MRRLALPLALLAALVCAAAAVAAERYQLRINAADEAAAKGVVLRKSDVGPGWKGGRKAPDLSPDDTCADFRPKRSDLVVTGAAASEFRHPGGVIVSSDVSVLASPAMVRADWRRTITHARMLPCLRRLASREMKASGLRVDSLRRVSFPRVAPLTAALRMVLRSRTGARFTVDLIALAKGRTEITLTVAAPAENAAALVRAQRRLARTLVGRARA